MTIKFYSISEHDIINNTEPLSSSSVNIHSYGFIFGHTLYPMKENCH